MSRPPSWRSLGHVIHLVKLFPLINPDFVRSQVTNVNKIMPGVDRVRMWVFLTINHNFTASKFGAQWNILQFIPLQFKHFFKLTFKKFWLDRNFWAATVSPTAQVAYSRTVILPTPNDHTVILPTAILVSRIHLHAMLSFCLQLYWYLAFTVM